MRLIGQRIFMLGFMMLFVGVLCGFLSLGDEKKEEMVRYVNFGGAGLMLLSSILF